MIAHKLDITVAHRVLDRPSGLVIASGDPIKKNRLRGENMECQQVVANKLSSSMSWF